MGYLGAIFKLQLDLLSKFNRRLSLAFQLPKKDLIQFSTFDNDLSQSHRTCLFALNKSALRFIDSPRIPHFITDRRLAIRMQVNHLIKSSKLVSSFRRCSRSQSHKIMTCRKFSARSPRKERRLGMSSRPS